MSEEPVSTRARPARAVACAAVLPVAAWRARILGHAGQLHRLYSLVALGLVLLTGVGGMTSFGQAAFVGLGAYTTAVLTTHTASRRG